MIRLVVGVLLGVLLGYLIARRPGFRTPPTYVALHTAEPSKTVTYDGSYPRQSVSWSGERNDAPITFDFSSIGMPLDSRTAVDEAADTP